MPPTPSEALSAFFVDTFGVWLLSVFIEFSRSARQQAERLWEAVKGRAGQL